MNWYRINKYANPRNISSTLGIPLEVAKIFTNKVGDKWDFLVARWFLDRAGIKNMSEDYALPHSKYNREHDALLMEGIGVMSRLVNLPIEERVNLARKSDKFLWFYYQESRDTYPESNFKEFKEQDLQDSLQDDYLNYFLEKALEDFNQRLEWFVETDFFRDLMSNKTFTKQYCKNLSYEDAIKEYIEKVKVKNMPVVLNLGEYKWVNAGSGLSEYVRTKMKNCGKASWGALRALDRDGIDMLLLLDGFNNPHLIASWVPKYVDYEKPNEAAKKFLGSIQGVGSSFVKQEYYPHVKALFEHLQPDLTRIENKGTIQDGKLHSNENLKEYLGVGKSDTYGISEYQKSSLNS